MELVTAAACAALGTFIFCVVLIGGRNPRQPRWASSALVANLYVPLVLSLWVVGGAYLAVVLTNLETRRPGPWQAGTSIAIVLAAATAIKALKVGQRLRRYAAAESAGAQGGRVIQLDPKAPEPKSPPGAGRAAA